jgi:hypothetical protein
MELRECKIRASVYVTVSLVHCFDIADSTSTNTRCRDGYTGVEAKLSTLLSSTTGGGE